MTAYNITARNVNTALRAGLTLLASDGRLNDSRNGPVLVAPGPVITQYRNPRERVLFSALRDANPFFHLYECVWMLAGRRDAAAVARYAKTMDSFAGADGNLAGAYGHRWRQHFGFDQLFSIVDMIRKDPLTRRAVLSMFDPQADLEFGAGSKDIPCNTAVYFDGTTGQLNMTVTNRSNDVVWGAYGANAVHMSFLQEVIAAAVGLPLGMYYQFSNNFHTYVGRPDVARLFVPGSTAQVAYEPDDRYNSVREGSAGFALTLPLWAGPGLLNLEEFLAECEFLASWPAERPLPAPLRSPYLSDVVSPMLLAHHQYKAGVPLADNKGATLLANSLVDWHIAGYEWLQRREVARHAAQAGVTQ